MDACMVSIYQISLTQGIYGGGLRGKQSPEDPSAKPGVNESGYRYRRHARLRAASSQLS